MSCGSQVLPASDAKRYRFHLKTRLLLTRCCCQLADGHLPAGVWFYRTGGRRCQRCAIYLTMRLSRVHPGAVLRGKIVETEELRELHQASPPFSVIVRTSARPPRRPRADAARSLSSNALNTFAAAVC